VPTAVTFFYFLVIDILSAKRRGDEVDEICMGGVGYTRRRRTQHAIS
jgi:hypothetical protein